jgi:hypothetical protein
MEYTVELQNRLGIGFLVGLSFYKPDEKFDYGEFIIYFGLLSLHIKYKKS